MKRRKSLVLNWFSTRWHWPSHGLNSEIEADKSLLKSNAAIVIDKECL